MNASAQDTTGNGRAQNGQGGARKRNRKRRNRSKAAAEYWGDKGLLPDPTSDIRITDDPSAVVRSLGRPPLPGQEHASEAFFAAVYGRAVGLSSALAAAGDLIEPEELLQD
jgi:hypothetical protein